MKKIIAPLLAASVLSSAAVFADDIPVNRVILSTSGLANFEHSARVKDNTKVEFPVRFQQVDDILKSMVVFDRSGRLGSVTLPGKQPLTEAFRDLPFNRGQLANPAALLNAYQGAAVALKGGGIDISGKLLQVVPEEVVFDNDKSVVKHRISVMTAEGLRQALLEDVQSVQFADEKIRAEIAKALDAVRLNSTSERRTLNVDLQGKGERDVTLSYVVDAPLWKTAYRMVVPEEGGGKGFLQGWAVIENMTAGDWNNVDLTLVSGNPVTYRQALYQSYYVDRPEIPVQVFGRVMPRMDSGTIANADEMEQAAMESRAMAEAFDTSGLAAMKKAYAPQASAMMLDSTAGFSGGASYDALADKSYGANDMAAAVSAAMSSEATAQVLFRFPDRVSLAAGQSMMLPFVSNKLPMTKVSLYQPDTNTKHPLAAVEIENKGDVSLPQGVLTLYEESKLLGGVAFAGDAQMPLLAQGEKRMISYALDSKTNIDREDKSTSSEGKISISQGVIRTAVNYKAATVYTVKAPEKEDRVVVIEHPKRGGDYKLVKPDPKNVEVTDDYYRIRVTVKAGDKKVIPVELENIVWQSWGISGLATDQLLAYSTTRGDLDRSTRKAFGKMVEIRREMDAMDQKIAQLDQQRRTIFEDQNRVRQNLHALSTQSDIQQKYLDKLNKQEEQIFKIDEEKQNLSDQRRQKQAELQQMIADLKF